MWSIWAMRKPMMRSYLASEAIWRPKQPQRIYFKESGCSSVNEFSSNNEPKWVQFSLRSQKITPSNGRRRSLRSGPCFSKIVIDPRRSLGCPTFMNVMQVFLQNFRSLTDFQFYFMTTRDSKNRRNRHNASHVRVRVVRSFHRRRTILIFAPVLILPSPVSPIHNATRVFKSHYTHFL